MFHGNQLANPGMFHVNHFPMQKLGEQPVHTVSDRSAPASAPKPGSGAQGSAASSSSPSCRPPTRADARWSDAVRSRSRLRRPAHPAPAVRGVVGEAPDERLQSTPVGDRTGRSRPSCAPRSALVRYPPYGASRRQGRRAATSGAVEPQHQIGASNLLRARRTPSASALLSVSRSPAMSTRINELPAEIERHLAHVACRPGSSVTIAIQLRQGIEKAGFPGVRRPGQCHPQSFAHDTATIHDC